MDTPSEDSSSLSQPETAIRTFLLGGDYHGAATLLLQSYANELLGYLISYLGDRELAREAFAIFARDMWQGLPKVQLRASARAWSYALARHAAQRVREGLARTRHEQPLSWSQVPAVSDTTQATPPYMRTENKQRLSELRARLSPEERELLTLRLDHGLDFSEIAVALGADQAQLATATARQRKRFQLLKRKLAKWLRQT